MITDTDLSSMTALLSNLSQLRFKEEPELGNRSNWLPESEEGQRLFDELTAPENREALRKWYLRFQGMELNPTAANLKASIEKAICETLG